MPHELLNKSAPPASTIGNVGAGENLLFTLMLFAALFLPVGAQYVLAAFVLGWLWREWRRTRASKTCGDSVAPIADNWITKPLILGCIIGFIITAVIGILGAAFGESELGAGIFIKDYVRLAAKQTLPGLAAVVSLRYLACRGWRFPQEGNGFLILAIVYCLYMVAQRYLGLDWIHGFGASIPERRFAYGVYRANGLISHPLTLGYNAMLGLVVFLGGWLVARKANDRSAVLKIAGLAAATGLTLFLTQSRWPLGVASGIIALGFVPKIWRSRYRFVLLMAPLLMLFFFNSNYQGRFAEVWKPGQKLEDSIDRIRFWKVHAAMAKDHPWLGVGYPDRQSASLDYYNRAGYTNSERKYSAHNIYLQTLADSGLGGFIGFLCFYLGAGITAWRTWRLAANPAPLFVVLAAGLGGLMQNTFRDTEFIFCFWFLLALALTWGRKQTFGQDKPSDRSKEIQNHQPGAASTHPS